MLWQIAYCIIAGLLIVVLPFLIYYYEADDEGMGAAERAMATLPGPAGDKLQGESEPPRAPIWANLSLKGKCAACFDSRNFKRSAASAFCYTSLTVLVAGLVIGLCYGFLNRAYLPYKGTALAVDTAAWAAAGSPIGQTCTGPGTLCPCGGGGPNGLCDWKDGTLTMSVTFVIYLAALLCFVGWFLFAIYVGIGFIALPLDCFNAFIHRPKLLSASDARNQKKALCTRTAELLKVGEDMTQRIMIESENILGASRSQKRKSAKWRQGELNRLAALVDQLERDLDAFQMSDPANYRKHYNPLVPYAKLAAGILSVAISVTWLLHIIVFMVFDPPLHPFLNSMLLSFDSFFPLFGTLTIGVMGLYLLLTAAKGAFKFGTRLFLIKVHPMEPGKTLINSMLFNVGLVLLCVLPTVQLCTDAFSQYVRLTDADVIFGTQYRYLEGFRYLWQYNVFLFAILGFALLSLIYFVSHACAFHVCSCSAVHSLEPSFKLP